MIKVGALAIVAALVPAALAAQEPGRNVFTVQPLTAVFDIYSGEYERVFGKTATWGVGATSWHPDDSGERRHYMSGEFKLRYYPSGTAPRGFSFGGAVGVMAISGVLRSGGEATVAGPSFGFLLEYQWLLGERENFAVTLGAGAKAARVSSADFVNGDSMTRYPTGRISVGWRF